MKKAIIACDDAGYLPLLQVYDELGFSLPDREIALKVCNIMENAIPMEIPFVVEPDIGQSWGEAK